MTSFWLEDVGPIRRRPPLDGSREADVAIVGGGFTGLWTAWYLLEHDPGLDVLVLEREYAGYGASGRNGTWCSPYINVGIDGLVRRFGVAPARALGREMLRTVDEVGRATRAAGIDAGYLRSGMLVAARSAGHLEEVRETVASNVAHGFDYRLLGADELADRIRIAGAHGALYSPHAATLHPGRLVRGLAEAVERRGAHIVESTAVTRVTPRDRWHRPIVRTDRGDVRAETIVLGVEAYLAQIPGFRRLLAPVYSLIVLTEPLDDATWERIGWAGRELVASERLTVEYLARTEDGRILFGGRGAPYRYGSRIDPATERHGPTHAELEGALRDWFPAVSGTRISHRWGGVLGVPRDGLLTATHNARTGLALGGGYTGGGVAASNLVGRVLADLILQRPTELTRLPIVDRPLPRWPPEPLRWIGIRGVSGIYRTLDALDERLGTTPPGRRLAQRVLHG